jgi:hypothetical protein
VVLMLACASVGFVVLLVLLVVIGCQVYWVFLHLTTHVIFYAAGNALRLNCRITGHKPQLYLQIAP